MESVIVVTDDLSDDDLDRVAEASKQAFLNVTGEYLNITVLNTLREEGEI